ncbi:MAG: pantetheine-phosphate adenylyltransferase [Deltaproteobacteria bacterium]|nr:pantetheine-phosphate adenylyltransferase [Deltaproteobacteria bacterium]
MGRIAVYAGSFDPITHGHLDLVKRASVLFDEVVLAMGENPSKKYLLSPDDRRDILHACTADLDNVHVDSFNGLLIDYCRKRGASVIVRGLRAVTDFEFEFQIGLANMDMAPDIETVFLLTEPRNIFISSSLVKEIATNGGDVQRYVPVPAYEALMKAING